MSNMSNSTVDIIDSYQHEIPSTVLKSMASFLRSILPDEWVLWLSNPTEDQEEEAQIVLHLRENDYSLALAPDVTRYEVVQFLKKVHDGGPDFLSDYEKLKDQLSMLFHLQVPVDDWDSDVAAEYRELFTPLFQQSVVFKGDSQLDVLHEKDDDGKWVTRLCKSWPTSPDELYELACINTDPTFSYPPLGMEGSMEDLSLSNDSQDQEVLCSDDVEDLE